MTVEVQSTEAAVCEDMGQQSRIECMQGHVHPLQGTLLCLRAQQYGQVQKCSGHHSLCHYSGVQQGHAALPSQHSDMSDEPDVSLPVHSAQMAIC